MKLYRFIRPEFPNSRIPELPNSRISEIQDNYFFALLRIGLWQKISSRDSEILKSRNPEIDWAYIYQLAIEQTVQGIIADGIGLYRNFINSEIRSEEKKEDSEFSRFREFEIPQYWNDKFLSASAQVVRQNFKLNQVLSNVAKLFQDQGITYVLLKGQGVAQNYPKPMLRCSGDIDLLMDEDNYSKAVELLLTLDPESEEVTDKRKHRSFNIEGIDVDVFADEFTHYSAEHLQYYRSLKNQMLHTSTFNAFDCFGITINTPPATFHYLYLFLHLYKHYTMEGLGLRQIIDWYLYEKANAIQIDYASLEKTLGELKQWDAYLLFKNFASSYLDSGNSNNVDSTIWLNCRLMGNFGHKDLGDTNSSTHRALIRLRKLYQWTKINRRQGLGVYIKALKTIFEFINILLKKYIKIS